jgi:uncharacterized protein (TIGR02147 family)
VNIYETDDYRKILSEVIAEKRFLDKSYTFQAMAAFIRVQKPYISKVINGRADFNSDQLYMACKYLEFSDEEIEYILLLLEFERCTYPERRLLLENKVESIQDSRRDSKHALVTDLQVKGIDDFDGSIYVEYYLNPTILIVHLFLTIPRFRNNLSLIAKELIISEDELNSILIKLVGMNIIEIENDKVKVLIKNMHLPRESKILAAHHSMVKQNGIMRLNRLAHEQKKNITATFASNEKSRKKIEIEFNKFIAKVQEISVQGKPDNCYQLNFELFPWSHPS